MPKRALEPVEHSVIAVYEWLAGVERAIRALQEAGLDPNQLSIIGNVDGEEARLGRGARGAGVVGVGGMLLRSALFFVPVLGPILVAGPLVEWMGHTLDGAAAGSAAGVFAAALASLRIPAWSVARYEREVKAGKFLVLARGGGPVLTALGTTSPLQLAAHAA